VAIALSAGGCSEWNYAVNGGSTVPGGTAFETKTASWVIVRSAVHDIPCETPAIAAPGSLDVDWVVQGCGQRITYRFLAWAGHTWQPVVVARVAMPEGEPVRPSDPPQAMAP